MLSYARFGITSFFFPQHIHPCISELLESESEGRYCAILSYICLIMHLSTLIFFFWYVITVPLSHFKIATLFLCGLQIVQFTWVQLPHWCLFKHFIWTVILKLRTHLTFLRCTGPSGCQQQGDCPLLPEVSAPWGFLALQAAGFPMTHSCSECRVH